MSRSWTRWLLAPCLVAAAVAFTAAPARADHDDDDGWRGRGWHHGHHKWKRWDRDRPYVIVDRPYYVERPRVIYEPRYYAPPPRPVYVMPEPYYAGVPSLTLNFPLR